MKVNSRWIIDPCSNIETKFITHVNLAKKMEVWMVSINLDTFQEEV